MTRRKRSNIIINVTLPIVLRGEYLIIRCDISIIICNYGLNLNKSYVNKQDFCLSHENSSRGHTSSFSPGYFQLLGRLFYITFGMNKEQ
jgi:hypothetical protein